MRVLVTGANGQLGAELTALSSSGVEFIGVGRSQLDVCDANNTMRLVRTVRPDTIVHSAAYTAVDEAEQHVREAFAVNTMGARNIAVAARETGASLCYISTDYVFDGTSKDEYTEADVPHPINAYGQSKFAGEVLVQALVPNHFVVRTSWLYGAAGRTNFVKTMLRLARTEASLHVVDDQIGRPTYALDLAFFIRDLIQTNHHGLYHACNSGSSTWYEFAEAIFEDSGLPVRVVPCTSEDFPRPALRPKHAVLSCSRLVDDGFSPLRHWREALQDYLRRGCDA